MENKEEEERWENRTEREKKEKVKEKRDRKRGSNERDRGWGINVCSLYAYVNEFTFGNEFLLVYPSIRRFVWPISS